MLPDPLQLLPHRYPFIFIDRLVEFRQGEFASATRRVTANDPWQFPLLFVEGIAQLAGIAVAVEEGEGGFLASIQHAEISRFMKPGDTLAIAVTVTKSFGRLHLVEGVVRIDGEVAAQASITIGVGALERK